MILGKEKLLYYHVSLSRYQLSGYTYKKCQDAKNGVWFQKSPHCEGKLGIKEQIVDICSQRGKATKELVCNCPNSLFFSSVYVR